MEPLQPIRWMRRLRSDGRKRAEIARSIRDFSKSNGFDIGFLRRWKGLERFFEKNAEKRLTPAEIRLHSPPARKRVALKRSRAASAPQASEIKIFQNIMLVWLCYRGHVTDGRSGQQAS